MKKRIGKCTKCGGNSINYDARLGIKNKGPITCLFCKIPMPIIYEFEATDEIKTKEINVNEFGYSLIGIEEQEDRAIETGEDDEILFYVPYEVFLKSDRYIKKYVEENIC